MWLQGTANKTLESSPLLPTPNMTGNLEGIDLIFNDADDFKRIFPDLAKPLPSVLAPGMEAGESNVAVPLHKDPYIIKNVVLLSPSPKTLI